MTDHPQVTVNAVVAAADQAWSGERPAPERMLLLRARPRWDGPDRLDLQGRSCRVVPCESTLAVRAALAERGDDVLVVLTGLDEDELGTDLLAQAVQQRCLGVDVWDEVRSAFRVRRDGSLDPALVRLGDAVAQALVADAPAGGWPPPPSGTLTADHAMTQLLTSTLGMPAQRWDLAGLLDWSLDPHHVLAYRDLPAPLRGSVRDWIVRRVGADVRPVLDLAESGHGTDAVALGVAALVLWGPGSSERAQGRFEQSYLGRHIPAPEVLPWAQASRGWVERALALEPDRATEVLARADQLVRDCGAAGLAERSDLLPSGFAQRLAALGDALAAAGSEPSAASVGDVERALHRVESHLLAGAEAPRVQTARMSARLVRWLHESPSQPSTLLEALEWQVRTGGWVDRARQRVWNGDSEPRFAAGLATVFSRASQVRLDTDRSAARLLANDVRVDSRPGRVVPVEEVHERLLRPLSASGPLLLLVLDGMSAAVASELAESVAVAGWSEAVPSGGNERTVVMSGLPSVTEVSRTSLLCGRRARGGQAEERAGFRAAAGDRSRLFHLADLAGVAGSDLPDDVREAVRDPQVPLVAAVLNAVDDSLAGGDPARTVWNLDAVRHLRPLLESASVTGRTVVLVSDHGHVVDLPDTGEVRSASGGGARWRPDGPDAADDEVLLAGPRVLLGDGRVVAAVDETLRFTRRREGYHGGAALSEVAIPLLLFVRRGEEPPPGWDTAGDQAPPWWSPARPADLQAEELRDRPDADATLFSPAPDTAG